MDCHIYVNYSLAPPPPYCLHPCVFDVSLSLLQDPEQTEFVLAVVVPADMPPDSCLYLQVSVMVEI
jgi:hypothetical protein